MTKQLNWNRPKHVSEPLPDDLARRAARADLQWRAKAKQRTPSPVFKRRTYDWQTRGSTTCPCEYCVRTTKGTT